jgi:hypothetical protein
MFEENRDCRQGKSWTLCRQTGINFNRRMFRGRRILAGGMTNQLFIKYHRLLCTGYLELRIMTLLATAVQRLSTYQNLEAQQGPLTNTSHGTFLALLGIAWAKTPTLQPLTAPFMPSLFRVLVVTKHIQ